MITTKQQAMDAVRNAFNTLNDAGKATVLNKARELLYEQIQDTLRIFDYNGKSIRTMEFNGQPWFVAIDVCNVLEIANSRDAVARLDEDEKNTVGLTDGNKRGNPNTAIVSESGLYSLILGSRKPEAKQFKRWITHEVIPSIRKTGGYIAGQETLSPEELMAKALLVAKQTLAERDARINELSCANSELTVQNQILLPRAQYFDELVDRNLLTNFRETAKELGIAPKRFVNWLVEQKYLYRDKKGKLLPYEGKNTGLFEIKEQYNPKTEWSGVQTLVTPKGRETFRLLCMGM
jgi:prophage antirepressor-like protein